MYSNINKKKLIDSLIKYYEKNNKLIELVNVNIEKKDHTISSNYSQYYNSTISNTNSSYYLP